MGDLLSVCVETGDMLFLLVVFLVLLSIPCLAIYLLFIDSFFSFSSSNFSGDGGEFSRISFTNIYQGTADAGGYYSGWIWKTDIDTSIEEI